MPRLARFTLLVLGLTLAVSSVGGLVRATDSGLGCADEWPGCNGELIPDFTNAHVAIEFSHRVLASLLGALTLVLVAGAWRRRRTDRTAFWLGLVFLPLVLVQALLGAAVVRTELEAAVVVVHLGGAMAAIGVLVALAAHLLVARPRQAVDHRLVRLTGLAAASVYGLNLLGSYVTGRHAGLAFDDWPLMGGRVIPEALDRVIPALHFAHRAGALVVGLVVVLAAVEARRAGLPRVARWSWLAAGLFGAQVVVGGLNVFTTLHSAVVTTHLFLSISIWATTLAAWAVARRSEAVHLDRSRAGRPAAGARKGSPGAGSEPRTRSKVAAYVALTKPRIIELLLVTTVPTMVVAEGGWPSTWLVVATVVGGTLAAGGANAINMVADVDIDTIMQRTRNRPLVTGELQRNQALAFALALEVAAFGWLWGFVNLLSAALALSATLFYVFVYTLWLKRRSTQNIVIGGAAGAVPVLVGWSAVTGSLGLTPLVLFAIIFYWTPPHFWALAIRYRDDYAAADVPMLPAVESLPTVARKVLGYTVLLWAISLVFSPVAGMGDLYLASAVVLGGLFTYRAVQLRRTLSPQVAMRVFNWSITYITLLFGAMAADRLLLG